MQFGKTPPRDGMQFGQTSPRDSMQFVNLSIWTFNFIFIFLAYNLDAPGICIIKKPEPFGNQTFYDTRVV